MSNQVYLSPPAKIASSDEHIFGDCRRRSPPQDSVVAPACSPTSLQHDELPLIRDSSTYCSLHASIMVGHDANYLRIGLCWNNTEGSLGCNTWVAQILQNTMGIYLTRSCDVCACWIVLINNILVVIMRSDQLSS